MYGKSGVGEFPSFPRLPVFLSIFLTFTLEGDVEIALTGQDGCASAAPHRTNNRFQIQNAFICRCVCEKLEREKKKTWKGSGPGADCHISVTMSPDASPHGI